LPVGGTFLNDNHKNAPAAAPAAPSIQEVTKS